MQKLIKLTRQIEDLRWRQFNKLYVYEFSHKLKGKFYWKCQCDCLEYSTVDSYSLKAGRIKSCGCILKEKLAPILLKRNTTHGLSKSREYSIWNDIMRRCYDPSRKNYKDYGGRGIKVSNDWKSFIIFYNDVAPIPAGLSIGRIDNNKGYSKENCRLEDNFQQANNRRNNHLITFNGETLTMMQISKKYNINYYVLRSRINDYKWPIEKAILTRVKSIANKY
jgi:hypothetical protein